MSSLARALATLLLLATLCATFCHVADATNVTPIKPEDTDVTAVQSLFDFRLQTATGVTYEPEADDYPGAMVVLVVNISVRIWHRRKHLFNDVTITYKHHAAPFIPPHRLSTLSSHAHLHWRPRQQPTPLCCSLMHRHCRHNRLRMNALTLHVNDCQHAYSQHAALSSVSLV
jgi:hypothetical protein